MTMRSVEVTQRLTPRVPHRPPACGSPASGPVLSVPPTITDLPGIRQALAATRHLLEMYRRRLSEETTQAATPRPAAPGRRRPTGPHHHSRKMRKEWPLNRQERNHQGKDNLLLFPVSVEDASSLGAISCRGRRLFKYYSRAASVFLPYGICKNRCIPLPLVHGT